MTQSLPTQQAAASRVREVLLHRHPPQRIDLRSTCRLLGVHERTLRRHLAAEGTSFAAIVSDTLLVVAKRYLIDERRTIRETAADLGFADKASFHRAFKRWTGMTPKSYRRLHLRPESTLVSECALPLEGFVEVAATNV
jgi:AraC-like DNA-binding protein